LRRLAAAKERAGNRQCTGRPRALAYFRAMVWLRSSSSPFPCNAAEASGGAGACPVGKSRGQKSEVSGQRSAVRGQRSAVRGQRSEVRGQLFVVSGWWSVARSAVWRVIFLPTIFLPSAGSPFSVFCFSVPSTPAPRHSVLDTRPSTLGPRPSTLGPRPSTLAPVPFRSLGAG
jgi:hypothetical protein